MKLIDFESHHEQEFYEMCTAFYSSPAVCHLIPKEHMKTTFASCLTKNPFLRGLFITKDERIIGYLLLSFTYSNEAGGQVVWIEEIFLKENFRGQGLGKQVFHWLFSEYNANTKRFRLEVTLENKTAKKLYQSLGFTDLAYEQMILDQ